MNEFAGRKNYQTQAVWDWIVGSEANEEVAKQIVTNALELAFTDNDARRLHQGCIGEVATFLEATYKDGGDNDSQPDLRSSMYADLLSHALSEVDWNDLAKTLINDVEIYETFWLDMKNGMPSGFPKAKYFTDWQSSKDHIDKLLEALDDAEGQSLLSLAKHHHFNLSSAKYTCEINRL